MTIPLDLAAALWLSEPNEETLARARDAGLSPEESASDLACSYTDLFVLNVYPYGSVFNDPAAGLNGEGSIAAARRFAREGYRPAQLSVVAAPDHVGLCLGYLAEREKPGESDPDFLFWLLGWLPVCTAAVERDPSAIAFYRRLARATLEAILARSASLPVSACASDPLEGALEPTGEDGQLRLADVLDYLLAPCRCGLFLSRSSIARIGRECDIAIPFSGRFDAMRQLFEAAGESGRVEIVLRRLEAEVVAWRSALTCDGAGVPAETAHAAVWKARLDRSETALAELSRTARDFSPPVSALQPGRQWENPNT